MSEEAESPKQPKEEAPVSHAERAFKLFVNSAREYASSETAQAAYIANEIRNDEHLDVLTLRDALLGDTTHISTIVDIANAAHRAVHAKDKPSRRVSKWTRLGAYLIEKPPMEEISYEKAFTTVSEIFSRAGDMDCLDESDFEIIFKQYPQVISDKRLNDDHTRVSEVEYGHFADTLINAHSMASDQMNTQTE